MPKKGIQAKTSVLHFVLAEAALETVPKEIADHPAVRRNAEKMGKKPLEMLLDISLHHAAMKRLPNMRKRGRPDIVHTTLLQILGSPANLEGHVRTFVHTINDYIIRIRPDTRIPRSYPRFVGLMEQLFKEGRVPPKGEPLIILRKGTLRELVKEVKPSMIFLLTEQGRMIRSEVLGRRLAEEEKPLVIVGGFQHGSFTARTIEMADEKIAVYRKPLDTWVVASIILHAYERALKIL